MPRALATRISAGRRPRAPGSTLPAAPVDGGARDGLHGVDDEQVGLDRLDVAEHGREVGLGGEEQAGPQRADALGAQPHLRGRLLAGDVEHASCSTRAARGGDVEQQGGLADPGLAGEQHDGPGHEAAAEHPVELADAASARCSRRPRVDLADRAGPGSRPTGRRSRPPSARRPRRPCPTPGTRRSGRPTAAPSSRTRRSGRWRGTSEVVWRPDGPGRRWGRPVGWSSPSSHRRT